VISSEKTVAVVWKEVCSLSMENAAERKPFADSQIQELTRKSVVTKHFEKVGTDELRDVLTWTGFGICVVHSSTTVPNRTRELECSMLLMFSQLSERLTRSEDCFIGLVAKVRFCVTKHIHINLFYSMIHSICHNVLTMRSHEY
jgi:regulator of replication initiation timing